MGLGLVLAACGPGSPGSGLDETQGSSASDSIGETGETAESGESESTGAPETDTGTTSDTETETETGEACIPGELDCECLPDGTCLEWPEYLIGCDEGGTCQGCGFGASIVSPPCRPDACPTDCVIVLSDYGLGPLADFTTPFFSVWNAGDEQPYLEDCADAVDGWAWTVFGEQFELCGGICEAWKQPALEGTTYTLELSCPPG